MKNTVYYIVMLLLLAACNPKLYEKSIETNLVLQELVQQKNFKIESYWASPQITSAMQQLNNVGLLPVGSSTGRIDISSNTNYLTFRNDSVIGVLPFFGERQFGGGYNNSGGIEFEDIPTNLEVQKDKSNYTIRFNINDKNTKTENYQVFISLYRNLSSVVNINSSHRNNILYRGKVSSLNK